MSEEERTEEELLSDELDELDNLYTEDENSSTDDDASDDDDSEANEEESKDEPEEDSKEESEEDSEEDKEESEASETETKDDRYEKLLNQINDLKGKLAEKSSKEPEVELESIDFLSEISLDDLGSNPEILNKVFNKILQEAVKSSSKTVPQTVSKQMKESWSAHEISTQFYKDNKDLSNVRNVVKACTEQIISEHEDWEVGQILEESAKRTRESLGMPIPNTVGDSAASDVTDVSKASFSEGSRGSRQVVKKDSALQQELDEM